MGSTVIGGITYPESVNQPTSPEDLRRGFEEIMRQAVPQYANATERTVRYATLGISPTPGAVSYRVDAGWYETWTGTRWAPLAGTLVARGSRTTSSTSSATEQGVLRLDGIPVAAGQTYLVWTNSLLIASTVNNDVGRIQLRIDTSGAAATTASTLRVLTQVTIPSSAAGQHVAGSFSYVPPTDQTLSVLLSHTRPVGSGLVVIQADPTFPIEMYVAVAGRDPGNTGVSI